MGVYISMRQKRVDPCESCTFFEECGCGARCAGYLERRKSAVNGWSDYETDAEQQKRSEYYQAFAAYAHDFDDDDCYP